MTYIRANKFVIRTNKGEPYSCDYQTLHVDESLIFYTLTLSGKNTFVDPQFALITNYYKNGQYNTNSRIQ